MSYLKKSLDLGKLFLKNRLIMPPMATSNCPDGIINQGIFDYYKEKSQGGYISLIIIEHSYISKEGRASRNQVSIADDRNNENLKELAKIIQQNGTKAVMQKFADENKMGARQIIVLDNPKKTLPCGWNVLLDNYTGEAVIRVDAHAHIPEDFVSKNVKVLEEGEMVVGGVRPNIVDEETPWKDTLLLAESSMFGSSIAPYRNGGNGTEEKIYMKSLFHAAYRREVFEKIGHYNTRSVCRCNEEGVW